MAREEGLADTSGATADIVSTRSTVLPAGEDVAEPDQYQMTISRLTVDKLGVKLYDKASAVVAELVANAYDADAETVTVEVPLGTELAAKDATGTAIDKGLTIVVRDDGHGMTPVEAQQYFLRVGTDRRVRTTDGAMSRDKGRRVMGRKGIGKLAPFGICRRIEVISSGGPITDAGYRTSHFILDFDQIVQDVDQPVPLDSGDLDRTFRPAHGTEVRLYLFLPNTPAGLRDLAAWRSRMWSSHRLIISGCVDCR